MSTTAKQDWESLPSTKASAIVARTRAADAGAVNPANVAGMERLISGAAGGGLILVGLLRRTVPGVAVALLGAALLRRAVTGKCSIYRALGVDTAFGAGSPSDNQKAGVRAGRGVKHESSVAISRAPEELFEFWRQFEHLPTFFEHLSLVTNQGDGRSHWIARGPLGELVEWDAEIHNEKPGELIAWRSLAGSDVDSAGSVHFRRAGNHLTIVTLSMKYDPPAGRVGATVASWLGECVSRELDEGVRRFKQITEAGEIPSVAGQPHGSCR